MKHTVGSAALVVLGAIFFLSVLITSCGRPAVSQQTVDTLTWVNPTKRTDGTALTNLTSIRIQWGASATGPLDQGQKVVAAPATSTTVPRDSTPGTRCYGAVAIDATGLESAPSNTVCKTIVARPEAPASLTVS